MLPLLAAAIISTTVSNSSTGGNVVQGGDVVTGSSYSSVSVQTYDSGEGGTSTVEIETGTDGHTSKQVITKPIAPGGDTTIYVATSSGGSRVEIRTLVGAAPAKGVAHATTTLSTGAAASSSIKLASIPPAFGLDFRAILQQFFSFWHIW